MRKKDDTVRYTAEELAAARARDGDRTDVARLDAMTDNEIQRDLAKDPDWQDVPRDWYKQARLETGIPHPWPRENKRPVTMRLDPDILEHFKRSGRGWQSRINAILRSYIESQQRG
jgi:uncharacterized protein (DUF4415 family)